MSEILRVFFLKKVYTNFESIGYFLLGFINGEGYQKGILPKTLLFTLIMTWIIYGYRYIFINDKSKPKEGD